MASFGLLCGLICIHFVSGFIFETHVCYDSVGCFNASNPFDNSLGNLPDSPDKVQARAYLWTQQNPDVAQELLYLQPSSVSDSNFDATRPTKVLIHGYMSSKAEPIIANLSVALLKKMDCNVIGIDWSKGAKKFYPKAVANTRLTGAVVAKLISMLQDKFGLKLSDLHIIGHSLGAHTAGYVGSRIHGIARITGLDPAGPMFTKTAEIVRLDATDAMFVDAIHSDAAPLHDAGFGTMEALGHIDFYPNGGQYQPGCPPPIKTTTEDLLTLQFADAFASVACSHDRAIWYFIESILNDDCQFKSFPCQSWKKFLSGTCTSCGGATCPTMGINSYKTAARGSFYLKTNTESPFCKSGVVIQE